jgi:O-antigen ligase
MNNGDRASELVVLTAILIGLLTFGALAFGAVHDWSRTVLVVFSVLLGLAAHQLLGPSGTALPRRYFELLICAVLLQVVPVPGYLLRIANPRTAEILEVQNVQFGFDPVNSSHAVSIDPANTLIAISVLVACASCLLAVTILCSRGRLRSICAGIAFLGAVVSIQALAQNAISNGRIYWWWVSEHGASYNYFGPFVNRNHFAGWMLLGVGLATGLLIGMGSRVSLRGRTLRSSMASLGSRSIHYIVLIAVSITAMVTALVWSMSRSGMIGLTITFAVLAGALAARTGHRYRYVGMMYLSLVIVGVGAWKGPERIASWYTDTRTLDWRLTLWRDSWPAAKDFWLTGSGLNTYADLMLAYARTDITAHPNTAHNDYLQLAIEGGLLVGIPALLVATTMAREIVRRLRQPQDEMTWWIRVGATAGICGILIQELTEFSLQIPGVAILFVTCIAIAIHEPASRVTRKDLPSRRVEQQRLVTSI